MRLWALSSGCCCLGRARSVCDIWSGQMVLCARDSDGEQQSRGNRVVIERVRLGDQVHAELVRRICEGSLPAGSHIAELALAEELGVSRTPLREGLARLEREGLLVADAGRGWTVSRVTAEDVREVYPIIAALEGLAVALTPDGGREGWADELDAENAHVIQACSIPLGAQQADDRWHRCLIGRCGNERLIGFVEELKRLVHRCEYAYMAKDDVVEKSADCHRRIANAVRKGDLSQARELLEENWLGGMEAMCDWLAREEANCV